MGGSMGNFPRGLDYQGGNMEQWKDEWEILARDCGGLLNFEVFICMILRYPKQRCKYVFGISNSSVFQRPSRHRFSTASVCQINLLLPTPFTILHRYIKPR